MPRYMLLLYADEPDRAAQARRDAELPAWHELTESLRDAGLLVSNSPLQGADTATTVRVRDTGAERTDGPFATTKEILVGYYLIECPDLDAAVEVAERMPLARYGSVEVRPAADLGDDC
jgi:hypothetical protein